MGKFGVSYLEILLLFETWVGHRLSPEKTVPVDRRTGRLLSVGCTLVSEGVRNRVGCKFVGGLFRSLPQISAGLQRFLPGSIGSHLSRLRYLGWLQCSHGLTQLDPLIAACLIV